MPPINPSSAGEAQDRCELRLPKHPSGAGHSPSAQDSTRELLTVRVLLVLQGDVAWRDEVSLGWRRWSS